MRKIVTATYDKDSKGYHRFQIDQGKGLTGAVYVPKDEKIPEYVKIYLKTKGELEQDEEELDQPQGNSESKAKKRD